MPLSGVFDFLVGAVVYRLGFRSGWKTEVHVGDCYSSWCEIEMKSEI